MFVFSIGVRRRGCKILENVPLEVASNFEEFQGLPLKKPWIKIEYSPLKDRPWPWKSWPRTCLELQGLSRLNLDKPWSKISIFPTLDLELKKKEFYQGPWKSLKKNHTGEKPFSCKYCDKNFSCLMYSLI